MATQGVLWGVGGRGALQRPGGIGGGEKRGIEWVPEAGVLMECSDDGGFDWLAYS